MRTGIGLDFHVLALDVCLQRLRLSERFVTRGKVGTVELGLVYVSVSLEPAVGGETLAASVPIACECPFGCRVAMGVFEVAL
jgi:hypothetical protein